MTWSYSQRSGELRRAGQLVAKAYSGHGEGKNNPDLQAVPRVGPIPRGRYRIGAPYDSQKVGPYALTLEPVGHDALGRSAFRIHGDSARAPGTASEGCIVPQGGRPTRERIWKSGDQDLEVVL